MQNEKKSNEKTTKPVVKNLLTPFETARGKVISIGQKIKEHQGVRLEVEQLGKILSSESFSEFGISIHTANSYRDGYKNEDAETLRDVLEFLITRQKAKATELEQIILDLTTETITAKAA